MVNNRRKGDMIMKKFLFASALGALMSSAALAGVPAEVADRLGKDLTPTGFAEVWQQGRHDPGMDWGIVIAASNVTYKIGDRHPDPYAD